VVLERRCALHHADATSPGVTIRPAPHLHTRSLFPPAPFAAGYAPPARMDAAHVFADGTGMDHGVSVAATRRATWRLSLLALLLSGAAFACALSDALSGPATPTITLRYSGDSSVVVGDTVAFAVTAEIDGTNLSAPSLRYAIEDTAVVSLTPAGHALVGRRRGRTQLIASLVSPLVAKPPTLSVTLDVVVGAVTIVPASDTLTSIDDTLSLVAPVFDAHGAPLDGVAPVWTSSDTTIATFVAPGRLVARRNGQVMVRALVDRDTGVGSVMITQRLARPGPGELDERGADDCDRDVGRSRPCRRQRRDTHSGTERGRAGYRDRHGGAASPARRDSTQSGTCDRFARRPSIAGRERDRQPRLSRGCPEQEPGLGLARSHHRDRGPQRPGDRSRGGERPRRGGDRRRARYRDGPRR